MEQTCVILTGTVLPNAIYGLDADDFALRKAQYLLAMRFYRTTLKHPIIYIDNSGYDFKNDADFARQFAEMDIELIEFPRSAHPSKGKGFQEFEMLNHVVGLYQSKFTSFIKITGRYIYTNIEELMQTPGNYKLLIDRHIRFSSAITSLFRCDFDFYLKFLNDAYLLADDATGEYIEKVLYKILKNAPKNTVSSFYRNPLWMVLDSKSNFYPYKFSSASIKMLNGIIRTIPGIPKYMI
jgi:hypothetical protein